MFKRIGVIIISLFTYAGAHGQDAKPDEKFEDDVLSVSQGKTDSLQHLLHHFGTFQGHMRSHFMHTVNLGSNIHYYALAAGGGLAYYSPVIRNFQVGLSGFIIYNLTSSALGSENGYSNRYELGLFDITNPDNHNDLDRLENLYIRYYLNEHQRSFIQAGKFSLRTPLINLQDGRMRPNLQEGLWFEYKEPGKLKARGGVLWRTSPRSTANWYDMGGSIGIYPNGRAVNGEPASYFGHVKTKNIFIANVEWQPLQNLTYQYWNYYADHLFNVALQKTEIRKKNMAVTWSGGFQYLWERSLSDGETPVQEQYIGHEEQSHVLSGRMAFIRNNNEAEWSVNYTRITAHGRFLFPREWGNETFFTFNNRERNEGAGNVHAVLLEHQRYLDKTKRMSIRVLAGLYRMPSVDDPRLNKYAMPSYYQLGLHGHYRFKGFLYGLQARMIYTYKGTLDPDMEYRPLLVHNKTDMHHLSIMMDYFF